jgi:threonine aldolase
MHRGGLFAAAGLYALEHMVDRLADDHLRARTIADGIRDLPGIDVNRPETNQVKVSTEPSGRLAKDFVSALAARAVLVTLREPYVFKMMVHHEINDEAVDLAVQQARTVVCELGSSR